MAGAKYSVFALGPCSGPLFDSREVCPMGPCCGTRYLHGISQGSLESIGRTGGFDCSTADGVRLRVMSFECKLYVASHCLTCPLLHVFVGCGF